MTQPGDAVDLLIVDDATELREMLADVFRYEGLTVTGTENGREAKDRLEAGLRPRAIVLDMMMPVMDGSAFLEWLRSSPYASIPVAMVSAALEPAPPGADAFFRKPVDVDELVAAVKQLLARR